MLKIVVESTEYFDESTSEFLKISKDQVLHLEHSLISIHKWEKKWLVPFIHTKDKTHEQTIDYIKCMTINQVDDSVYSMLSDSNIKEINDYIEAPMTATWFSNNNGKKSTEQITAELVYYWMIEMKIPFECQKWHFSSLMTLIRVCSDKNQPKKKTSQKDIISRNAEINRKRREALNSKG